MIHAARPCLPATSLVEVPVLPDAPWHEMQHPHSLEGWISDPGWHRQSMRSANLSPVVASVPAECSRYLHDSGAYVSQAGALLTSVRAMRNVPLVKAEARQGVLNCTAHEGTATGVSEPAVRHNHSFVREFIRLLKSCLQEE